MVVLKNQVSFLLIYPNLFIISISLFFKKDFKWRPIYFLDLIFERLFIFNVSIFSISISISFSI